MAHILLVEDEPWLGELYEQLFGREHTVAWCRDVYDAVSLIDERHPDVIVLDLLLAWGSGVQLLHELAGYGDTANIPIVLLSAALPEGLSLDTLRPYGVAAMLDKTYVKPARVISTVNGVIKAHAKHPL